MRYNFLLILIVAVVFSSCKKEPTIVDQPPGPLPIDPSIVQTFLKDIVIPNLPSPYYHFEYDASGKVSTISFASDFAVYNVMYSNNTIMGLKNIVAGNHDRLQYTYDSEGRVVMINYMDFAGEIYANVYLTYNGNKLIKLERERKAGADFIFNKRLTMSYYADGNLKEITYYFPVTPINLTEQTFTDHFENYDSKINVDGFGLLHSEFFDHLVFLPSVQLQKNNPAKETRTGDGVNYEVNYSYSYNEKNKPLSKTGDLTFLNGTNAGQKFQTNSQFSYYQ